MSAIVTRRMAPDEVDAVVDMWRTTMRDAYPYLPLVYLHTRDDDYGFFTTNIIPRCDVWVAIDEDEIVGFLAIADDYIDRLYVHPEQQRSGVGTALLERARELSPSVLSLHTHVKNASACAFYEKHGFTAVKYGTSPSPESEPDVEYRWTS